MADQPTGEGLKERLSRQSEEALGRLAEELAANSLVTSAVAGAFEARERAAAAQEAAMGVLGIPSVADVERLTRRIRSVSQRLEGIEDALDRIDERLAGLDGLGDRLTAALAPGEPGSSDELERRLEELSAQVASLREAVAPAGAAEPQGRARGADSPKASRLGRRRPTTRT